jgi:hypothetical protein
MSLTGFELWQLDVAIRLHFISQSYDAVKCNYRLKHTATAYGFNVNHSREIFVSVAKRIRNREEGIKFIASNRVRGVTHVTQMSSTNSSWLEKYLSAPTVYFDEDLQRLKQISPVFDEHLKLKEGDIRPSIFKSISSGEVSIESAALIEGMTQFMNRAVKIDPIGVNREAKLLLDKYYLILRSFMKVEDIRHAAIKRFTSGQ